MFHVICFLHPVFLRFSLLRFGFAYVCVQICTKKEGRKDDNCFSACLNFWSVLSFAYRRPFPSLVLDGNQLHCKMEHEDRIFIDKQKETRRIAEKFSTLAFLFVQRRRFLGFFMFHFMPLPDVDPLMEKFVPNRFLYLMNWCCFYCLDGCHSFSMFWISGIRFFILGIWSQLRSPNLWNNYNI